MAHSDDGRGVFGVVEALLAVVGAVTLMGVAAIAVSVVAWEMELRKSEQENASPEPQQIPGTA